MSWQHLIKKAHGPKGKHSKSIYLSESGLLVISKEFDDEMEQPLYVDIYYDVEEKLIGFVPTDTQGEDSYTIMRLESRGSPCITSRRLLSAMPHGRYLVTDKLDGNKIILKWSENYSR